MTAAERTFTEGATTVVVRRLGESLLRARRPSGPHEDLVAIGRRLSRDHAGDTVLLSSRQPHWERALVEAGYEVHRRKTLVRKQLATSAEDASLRWRSLTELGDAAFLDELVACAAGDPFEEPGADPEREWRELTDHAGPDFDRSSWRVAVDDGGTIGVVLATRYPNAPHEGTLSYVGVHPSRRRLGHGVRLHAAGLARLASMGVTTYFGSTDQRNTGMLRIFDRNGCDPVTTQVFLRPSLS